MLTVPDGEHWIVSMTSLYNASGTLALLVNGITIKSATAPNTWCEGGGLHLGEGDTLGWSGASGTLFWKASGVIYRNATP